MATYWHPDTARYKSGASPGHLTLGRSGAATRLRPKSRNPDCGRITKPVLGAVVAMQRERPSIDLVRTRIDDTSNPVMAAAARRYFHLTWSD